MLGLAAWQIPRNVRARCASLDQRMADPSGAHGDTPGSTDRGHGLERCDSGVTQNNQGYWQPSAKCDVKQERGIESRVLMTP